MAFENPRTADPLRFLPGEVIVKGAERPWRRSGEKAEYKLLHIDFHTGRWVTLDRFQEGMKIFKHLHKAPIEGYCISGSFTFRENHIISAGDYFYEPAGALHPEATALEDGTLIFGIYHGPLEFLDEEGNSVQTLDWEWFLNEEMGAGGFLPFNAAAGDPLA